MTHIQSTAPQGYVLNAGEGEYLAHFADAGEIFIWVGPATGSAGFALGTQQVRVGCIFCELQEDRIVASNALAFAIRDNYPVTEHHTLVIPKRHAATFFDLFEPERRAVNHLLVSLRNEIITKDASVGGFNIGMNSGTAAGQTIDHAHVHLIPRRHGDVKDPRGGVRGVIPGKAAY